MRGPVHYRPTVVLLVLLVALLIRSAAMGQDSDQSIVDKEKESLKSQLRDPDAQSSTGLPLSRVVAEIVRDNATGTMQLTNDLLSVTLAGPLKKGDSDLELANLSGLGQSVKATAALNVIYWNIQLPSRERAHKVCADFLGVESLELDVVCDEDLFEGDSTWIRRYRAAADEKHLANTPIYYFRVEGTAGRQSFAFADPTSLEEVNDDETVWSFGASAGTFLFNQVGISAAVEREYGIRANPPVTICRPLEGHDATYCVDLPIGRPNEVRRDIVSVSFLHYPGRTQIAFRPTIHRDLTKAVTGVEIPIYFVPGRDSGILEGGVTIGWRSDNEDLTYSLFIGRAIALY
ncbi:MAG: hypothetical protein GF341_11020 [candidate division Zixibacteria bacterium]|nr:hypothetical protein [candidate division Zixibacteria bacterium]